MLHLEKTVSTATIWKLFFFCTSLRLCFDDKLKWFGCRVVGGGDVIYILKVVSHPSVFGGLLITKWLKNKSAPAWLLYSCYQRLHHLTYQTNIKLRSSLKVCLPRCFLFFQVALPAVFALRVQLKGASYFVRSAPLSLAPFLPFPLSLSLCLSESTFD